MPRIAITYLNCALYLFNSEQEAAAGTKAGGSGFLVGVPAENSRQNSLRLGHFYAVTNRHVIERGGSSVIALNDEKGERAVLSRSADDWTFHPGGDDLAVCPLSLDMGRYESIAVPSTMFVSSASDFGNPLGDARAGFGVGDGVFMVGRFISHQGQAKNTPVVRFGNVAMMPLEPILQELPASGVHLQCDFLQESFLVDMRSLSGFSGSPVFWYEEVFTPTPKAKDGFVQFSDDPDAEQTLKLNVMLLGVDWGNLKAPYDFVKTEGMLKEDAKDTRTLHSNSGLSGVVPAWKLTELLNTSKLREQRLEDEAAAEKQHQEWHARAVENGAAGLD